MARKPNVLLITADQLRYDFVGYMSAAWVHTPNLDRLASLGAVCTQACSNSPICAPARVGLATGQMPHRLGALDNNCYLPFSARTYYQQLRDQGFNVGCVGKLDLAKPDLECGFGNLPRTYAWGFTHPMECMGRMDTGFRPPNPERPLKPELLERLAPEVRARAEAGVPLPGDPYTRWLDAQGLLDTYFADLLLCKGSDWLDRHCHDSLLPEEAYEDAFIAANACNWIGSMSGDLPWHLFVSFVGPHDPFNPPASFGRRYAEAAMPPPIQGALEGKPEHIRRRAAQGALCSEDTILRNRRQYCACIEAVDAGIGRILDSLAQTDQLENTYIIFTADHGELLFDHYLLGKHTAYESSMRIPMLVAGPSIEHQVIDDPVELIDVPATILDLVGVERMSNVDSRSLAPRIFGDAQVHREDCVCTEINYRALRTPQFKFIENLNAEDELYDLQEDPQELNNLIEVEPELAGDMRHHLRARLCAGGCLA